MVPQCGGGTFIRAEYNPDWEDCLYSTGSLHADTMVRERHGPGVQTFVDPNRHYSTLRKMKDGNWARFAPSPAPPETEEEKLYAKTRLEASPQTRCWIALRWP